MTQKSWQDESWDETVERWRTKYAKENARLTAREPNDGGRGTADEYLAASIEGAKIVALKADPEVEKYMGLIIPQ